MSNIRKMAGTGVMTTSSWPNRGTAQIGAGEVSPGGGGGDERPHVSCALDMFNTVTVPVPPGVESVPSPVGEVTVSV